MRKTKKKTPCILVIHGPNLNLLGEREIKVYGKTSLNLIDRALKEKAKALGVGLTVVQSNHEGKLIDLIGSARKKFDGILINPAAYTHTSVALRDALLAAQIPAVEVHLSNIYGREEFRHQSLTAPACVGMVSGFKQNSYLLGLEALAAYLREAASQKEN